MFSRHGYYFFSQQETLATSVEINEWQPFQTTWIVHGTAIFRYRITSGTSNPRQILMKHKKFSHLCNLQLFFIAITPKWIVAHRHLQSVNKAVCESERFLFRDMYFVPFCLLLLQRPLDIEKTEESLARLLKCKINFTFWLSATAQAFQSLFVSAGRGLQSPHGFFYKITLLNEFY